MRISKAFRGVGLPACLAGLLAAAQPAAAADLTVGAFGGVWEQSLRRCVVEPFEKQTGKTVSVVLGTPAQWLNQVAASPAHPPLDVIYNPADTAFEAINRHLLVQFTREAVPNAFDLQPKFMGLGENYGAPHNYGGMGLIYNTQTVKNPPKDWKAFVEGTVRGDWHASAPSINYPSGGFNELWLFSKLYGGGVDDIRPGIEQFQRMEKSGNLVFWNDPNTVLNGLKSGDIDIAMYWDGRAYSFIDGGNKGFAYTSPDPGVMVGITWIQVVKNAPPLALDYANFSLTPAAQSCFGSAIRYGVANKAATFDPAIQGEITPAATLLVPPSQDIVPKEGAWLETWNKQVGR